MQDIVETKQCYFLCTSDTLVPFIQRVFLGSAQELRNVLVREPSVIFSREFGSQFLLLLGVLLVQTEGVPAKREMTDNENSP